jgi:hypothetical protein
MLDVHLDVVEFFSRGRKMALHTQALALH